MSILNWYLLRQNILFILIILFSGMGIYLIVDFVTRMDSVVGSGVPVSVALKYFALKIPLIVSQIMPAIFMLAVLVQVALMHRSNEMLALESNGISFFRPALFFIIYALAGFVFLSIFSETLGIYGYQQTKLIWDGDIRHRQIEDRGLEKLWFSEKNDVVYIQKAWPDRGTGEDITVYRMGSGNRILEIIRAAKFKESEDGWVLSRAMVVSTEDFSQKEYRELEMSMATRLKSFSAIASSLPYDSLSMFNLGRLINELKSKGSNVEKLATAWHSKLAYSFALVVMTVLGLALACIIRNIYALVTLGLVIVFLYYTVYVFGVTYAEEGLIPPFWGAWLANIIFAVLGGGQLIWSSRS
ncbi:MAG: LptF/LptG family permease [Desulfonatronovibrionaceae bacterium]